MNEATSLEEVSLYEGGDITAGEYEGHTYGTYTV